MRRWNGWGEEGQDYPVTKSAAAFLAELVGPGNPLPDEEIEEVIDSVPESRSKAHPLITTEAVERLLHARGQSLPDWVALRSGRIGLFPDGVAYPAYAVQVRELLDFARETDSRLIPYGGGTSVVGHINPPAGDAPVITVDLSRFNRLVDLDEASRLATFEAGIRGSDLEDQLRPRGYTLGHFPQSFEYSTLGGWIATRSCGQQSYFYGRIEDLFAGGHVETPVGTLELPAVPASAAGPDLRHCILGSEGRFGLITQATVRIRPLPETERFQAIFFRNWSSGIAAVRAIVQSGIPVSMLRLSDPQETQTTLILSGKERLVNWADRGLRLLRYGSDRCLLIFAATGDGEGVDRTIRETSAIARQHGGISGGGLVGNQWRMSRYRSPYLRNTLWEMGYAVDTLETAVPWVAVLETAAAIKAAIQQGLEDIGERVLVMAHLSHVYADGASIYVTFLFRRSPDPDETLHRWQVAKTAASQAIVDFGGTISHQHGVGLDHRLYLEAEKGILGLKMVEAMRRAADPDGLMNPGKLLPEIDNVAKGLEGSNLA